MPTKEVPLNGAVLAWARTESGFSQDEIAQSLGVEPALVGAWENGQARPTKGQFTRLVDLLKRPSSVFFLPRPPSRALPPS